MSGRLIQGVGTNDADYAVVKKKSLGYVNGVYKQELIWECHFYRKWRSMLTRCYSNLYPSYKGCSVCNEWLTFSNFKSWMEQQDWEGKELDKDLLIEGNKVYSPETCLFIDAEVNLFLKDVKRSKGYEKLPNGRFSARIKENNKDVRLGVFDTETQAKEAYLRAKNERLKQLVDKQTDHRVIVSLLKRLTFIG